MSRKKGIRYAMAAGLLAFMMSGCSGSAHQWQGGQQKDGEDKGQVTLRVFDKNASSSFQDEIAQAIMEQTGIHIELEEASDDPDKKVDIMLAYKSYPDIILVDLKDIDQYRESGSLLDISSYVDREDSSVRGMYGDMLNRIREEDGSIYYLTNWYGEDRDAVSAFQIRYDYLCRLVGKERADSDEPFTQEEFIQLLRDFKEEFPEIDGKASIPFTVNLKFQYENCFQGMYGMKLYYEKDSNLYNLVRHPKYPEMLGFMNTMYREGLMDKSWVVSNETLFQENVKSGRVFATASAYWDIGELNRYLAENYGEDAVMLGYKVLGKGISEEETTYGGRNCLGWDAIAITDHCKNVDAAMKLVDYLASEEGQYLMLWGIEGKHWQYEDGKHVPSPEVMEMLENGTLSDETPIRRWTWFIKNGYGSDGTPYDLKERYLPGRPAQVSNRNMKSDYWDMAPYSNLEPEKDSREALQWKNIQDIYEKAYPRMVNASSEEEMRKLYEKMLEDMNAEGMADVEAVITRRYQERLKRWRMQVE